MHHNRVALANERLQGFKLGAICVLAGRLVREYLTDHDVLKLALRILVEAADPNVADALNLQDASQTECVRKKSKTPRDTCQERLEYTLI